MKYELEIISDIIYNVKGKPNVIIKQDKIKKIFNLYDIDLEEYVEAKTGKHIKKYCTIVEENTYYKINKPYEELKALIQNKSIPILGLAAKAKWFKKVKAEEELMPEHLEDNTDESEVKHYIDGHNTKTPNKRRKAKPSKRISRTRQKN